MSGDQVLQKPLLSFETPAKQNVLSEKSKESKNIIVSVKGHMIQSNLNPNALEFIPSFKEKKPQIFLNEVLRKSVLKVTIEDNLNQERNFKKDELLSNERKLIQEYKSIETNYIRDMADIKEIEAFNNNIERNQLLTLFASSSKVQDSSSETENVILEDDCRVENILEEINDVNKSNKEDKNNEENKSNHEDKPGLIENIFKSSDDNNKKHDVNIAQVMENQKNLQEHKSLEKNAERTTDIESQSLKSEKQGQKEIKTKDCTNITTTGKQHKLQANDKILNIKDPKIKSNLTNRGAIGKTSASTSQQNYGNVSRTGTTGKTNVSTAQQYLVKETKKLSTDKDIKLKAPAAISQNCKISKTVKNNLITKTTTDLKQPCLSLKKPAIQASKFETRTSKNKDSISNRSSSFTDKSSTSTRSSTQSSRIKPVQTPKTKDSVSKSPRATVSSKLRKTETQKRRNLFFDLDTIKMSDFLFK
ncbi:intracellular protein transport protein USO1-like isoform X2 [Lucilia cuprina]|uniref:intracellular protein transport protein USO1-like isoform X2 n=1 Tax=Lucilia cuprina TaxID=7375 RepID=UPI001F05C1CD|nr:intracellular protein transport protein USO1-like isoform X2 [Lucilia cuprina]